MRMVDNSFKLGLLLDCLQITCRHFKGDEEVCCLSEKYFSDGTEYPDCHVACNCNGRIECCDLPEKFHVCLV